MTQPIQFKGLTDEQNGYLRALNELSTLIERIADEGRPELAQQIHVEAWVPLAAEMHFAKP